LREDLRGFPFESTTGVEGVLEMPEAEGERGSLGVEEMRLVLEGEESGRELFRKSVRGRVMGTNRDGNEKSAFGGGWSFYGSDGVSVGIGLDEERGGG
jgi:hypothetical protein